MKYAITYYVEIDEKIRPDLREQMLEAGYWHDKVLDNPSIELPDHVLVVHTVPRIERVG